MKCKFCYMAPDGDAPDDREDLFNIHAGDIWDSSIEMFGTIWNDKLEISLGFGCIGGSEEVKINYCPVCGRRLEEAE